MGIEQDKVIAEALGTVGMVPSMASDDGHETYPHYSTNDAAALEGIKAIRERGVEVYMRLFVGGGCRLEFILESSIINVTADGEDGNDIAAALADAMVEDVCSYCSGRKVRACCRNGDYELELETCSRCQGTGKGGLRVKPALREMLC